MLSWETWARDRAWLFHHGWPQVLQRIGGGALRKGAMRDVPMGFEGRFGEYPCFGFRASPGTDPWGGLDVLALRVPGAGFPPLTVAPVVETIDGNPVPISADFDLEFQAVSPSPRFARDVLVPGVLPALRRVPFDHLWFERDAILVDTRSELHPEDVDDYLRALHTVVDAVPVRVLAAVGAGRALPVPRPPMTRPGMVAQQRFQFGTSASAWRSWAEQRRWVFTEGKDIHSRLRHRIPAVPEGHGFVGKYADLPVFGFAAVPLRNVIGVRIPGTDLPPITIHRDDEVVAELLGAGGVEVGEPAFDYAWRIKSDDVEGARRVLRPQLRHRFEEAPPFDRLWFGGDSISLITTQAIAPGSVDGLLAWLVSLAAELPLPHED
ncbi:hypothetical protein [uncultured Tessaracoccus sp.]|uniref:hypothetical protein n=1 Tax=uncultured Tessaracoccus sp. TaxID=905023 RepID=UPI0025E9887E|nr:hypothetical protein [uncultured Tessaracoccus sp.]